LNDVLDESIKASVDVYETESKRSRESLVGTLGLDLRNPLRSISMRAAVLARMTLPQEAQDVLARMPGASVRMGQ
jgi:signal transduction histidine kinase